MDEFVVELTELAASPRARREVGGKAYHLARLVAAGLPVPPGIVLTASVAALDEDARSRVLARAAQRLANLGRTFVVRSSVRCALPSTPYVCFW